MTILIDEENRLRQGIDRIVHHIINITDNAHTIAFKSPFPVTTTLPRKCGKDRPEQERGRPYIGIVTERHKREREHNDQMDREVDPRGQIPRHRITFFYMDNVYTNSVILL